MTRQATLSAPTCFSIRSMARLRPARRHRRPAVAERVGHRHAVDLGRERPERVLVGHVLRGQRHREVGAAVVAVVEDDDRLPPGVGAGDLHRVLDGLGTGVEQRRALLVVARRQPVERLAHVDVALVRRDHEAGVGEAGDLLLHPGDHGVGRVADVDHRDARAEVDQRVAVDVDEHAAARPLDEDGQRRADAARDRCVRRAGDQLVERGRGSRSRGGAPGGRARRVGRSSGVSHGGHDTVTESDVTVLSLPRNP